MIPRQLRKFISDLSEFTGNGSLLWNEADNGAYFCDHKNHTLHIWSHHDCDRERSFFTFKLVTDGKTTPFTVTEDEADYDVMRNLYELVIANANNVSEDIKGFFDKVA